MEKPPLLKKILGQKKVKDYTYATLFFLVAAFFSFFVIRPTLITAFSLQKKAKELQEISSFYEKNILAIIEIQSKLEKTRNERHLIEEAVPKEAKIKFLADNLRKIASKESVLIKNLSLSKIELKQEKKQKTNYLSSLNINLSLQMSPLNIKNFTEKLFRQRRLLLIKKMQIGKEEETSSPPATLLKVEMSVDSFYE